MWKESMPKIGDTVKIEFSDWYAELIGANTIVGVVDNFLSNCVVVDVGDRKIWFPAQGTVYVYKKY